MFSDPVIPKKLIELSQQRQFVVLRTLNENVSANRLLLRSRWTVILYGCIWSMITSSSKKAAQHNWSVLLKRTSAKSEVAAGVIYSRRFVRSTTTKRVFNWYCTKRLFHISFSLNTNFSTEIPTICPPRLNCSITMTNHDIRTLAGQTVQPVAI